MYMVGPYSIIGEIERKRRKGGYEGEGAVKGREGGEELFT